MPSGISCESTRPSGMRSSTQAQNTSTDSSPLPQNTPLPNR